MKHNFDTTDLKYWQYSTDEDKRVVDTHLKRGLELEIDSQGRVFYNYNIVANMVLKQTNFVIRDNKTYIV